MIYIYIYIYTLHMSTYTARWPPPSGRPAWRRPPAPWVTLLVYTY